MVAINTNNPNGDMISLLWGIYYQLQQVVANGGGGSGGVNRSAAVISTSGSGNTATGVVQVWFYNSGTSPATVGGAPLPSGTSLNFSTTHPADTIGPISYNATGTTLLIGTLA